MEYRKLPEFVFDFSIEKQSLPYREVSLQANTKRRGRWKK